MPRTQNKAVMIWLFIFSFTVAFLVVFGGFVRLTRSGLSIVEWNPLSGSLPPVGEQAWQDEFTKYQGTPEYIGAAVALAMVSGLLLIAMGFLKLGFLDGWPGYSIAWLTAFSTFLRYAKARESGRGNPR